MKNRGLPEQIAETIVSDVILPRSLAPGDQLPTVRELQRKFELYFKRIRIKILDHAEAKRR